MSRPAVSRRQILFLAGSASLSAADDFWNSKPASAWDAGEIYRLLNHSPWASLADWYVPLELPGPPRPKSVITWESAQPVRDARKRPLPWTFGGCYAVGVDGMASGGRSATSLRRSVALRTTGKHKWSIGATLATELIGASSVYVFAFPRATAPIDPDTPEVIFEMHLGRWRLDTRFKPKEMFYRGQLAV